MALFDVPIPPGVTLDEFEACVTMDEQLPY